MRIADLPIPTAANNIYVLGGGISLDLFDFKKINRATDIVIATNSAISLITPTYQVCGDPHAIKYWGGSKYNKDGVIWVANPSRLGEYAHLSNKYISSADLFRAPKGYGTGLSAIYLAYYINQYAGKQIQSIYYIGYDYAALYLPGYEPKPQTGEGLERFTKTRYLASHRSYVEKRLFNYAAKLRLMPYQRPLQAPAGWQAMDHKVRRTESPLYKSQFASLVALLSRDRGFRGKLRCLSGIDITRLTDKTNHGYKDAFKNGVFK